MNDTAAAPVHFSPRRLGHANLFVGELNRSVKFYSRICGLEEVRREPGIGAGFLSNGNTHHDVGLVQVADEERVGVGGHVQITGSRMKRPGLNHLGWELESEKQLVEAYERALAAGLAIHRTTDHQISHSVYVFDPEGNLNEFYADAMHDWRSIFNPDRDDLVSSHWDPLATPPSDEPMYDANPDLRRVDGAVFHARRITRAFLVATDLNRLRRFYEDVGGLAPVSDDPAGGFVCLRGTRSQCDLVLFAVRDGLHPGLHHVSFEVDAATDLDCAVATLLERGHEIEHRIDAETKRSVFVRDPDGIRVELYQPGTPEASAALATGNRSEPLPYLV